MLWAEGGRTGRIALLVTAGGVVLTGDIPLAILNILASNLYVGTSGLSGQVLTVVLLRPASLILLAMGIFYLWVYVRRDPGGSAMAKPGGPGEALLVGERLVSG